MTTIPHGSTPRWIYAHCEATMLMMYVVAADGSPALPQHPEAFLRLLLSVYHTQDEEKEGDGM